MLELYFETAVSTYYAPIWQDIPNAAAKASYKTFNTHTYTRWFKYDRDNLCVNKSQFVLVIFEPPCINSEYILMMNIYVPVLA
jgi:hypothetical protein